MVVEFHDAAGLALKHDGHTAADIAGDDAHWEIGGERSTMNGNRRPRTG
jgi:hypothetical protein